MHRTFAFVLLFLVAASATALADQVAVFDLEWGRKHERRTRSFAIAFFEKQAPYTVYNFKNLVRSNFYVKTAIHRVIPNYLVQGGDPLSKKKDRWAVGTGGPGYTLPPEINRKHLRGSVAMGRLGDAINPKRLSNGSQFYVCLQSIPAQDGRDTVFGEVVGGLDALDEISRLPADNNANPVERVTVRRTYLIDRSQLGGLIAASWAVLPSRCGKAVLETPRDDLPRLRNRLPQRSTGGPLQTSRGTNGNPGTTLGFVWNPRLEGANH